MIPPGWMRRKKNMDMELQDICHAVLWCVTTVWTTYWCLADLKRREREMMKRWRTVLVKLIKFKIRLAERERSRSPARSADPTSEEPSRSPARSADPTSEEPSTRQLRPRRRGYLRDLPR